MNQPIIEVINVCKSFKKADHQDLLVLDNVNFSLHESEIVAILGKSGSGKSTLLRIIAGLIQPSAGKVFYRGQEVKRSSARHCDGISKFCVVTLANCITKCGIRLRSLGHPQR